MLILLKVLLLWSLHAVQGGSVFLPSLTWTNSLSTMDEVQAFLKGSHRMARERICFNVEGSSVVMGSSPNGSLLMIDALKEIEKNRQGHGLMIALPSITTFSKAHQLFKSVEGFYWVILEFSVTRGPNGGPPAFGALQLDQILTAGVWPKMFNLSLCVTTKNKGREKGYTVQQLKELIGVVVAARNLRGGVPVDLSVDVFHISHSKSFGTIPFTDRLAHLHLRTDAEVQDQVNMKGFMYLFNRFGPKRCYLNVPPKLQARILGYKEEKEPVTPAHENGIPSWASKSSLYSLSYNFFLFTALIFRN